jgi:hypothetical protein
MTRKQKAIREASKRLLLTDFTRWNIVEEILKDVFEAGVKIGRSDRNKEFERPINQYSKDNQLIDTFGSIVEAMDVLEIPHSSLARNLRGGTKKCHGFIFKYVSNEKPKRREVKNRSVKTD